MKKCPRCKLEFPATTEFWHVSKATLSGLYGMCKTCSRNRSKIHWSKILANPEKRAIENERSRLHKLKVRADPKYALQHSQRSAASVKKAYATLEGKARLLNHAYKRKRHVMSPIAQFNDDINRTVIGQIISAGLTVDHVLPLHGAMISGLHVPYNLEGLTLSENCSKGTFVNLEKESLIQYKLTKELESYL